MTVTQAAGLGTPISIGGRKLVLGPPTIADLAELQNWVNTQLPDPIKVAKELADGLPADVAEKVVLAAYEDVRAGARKLGSPEATSVLPKGNITPLSSIFARLPQSSLRTADQADRP